VKTILSTVKILRRSCLRVSPALKFEKVWQETLHTHTHTHTQETFNLAHHSGNCGGQPIPCHAVVLAACSNTERREGGAEGGRGGGREGAPGTNSQKSIYGDFVD
jgi:hypothetical protein